MTEMAESKPSVAEKVKQFEKMSPTGSTSKVAEIRARLEKNSPQNGQSKPTVPARSNSASKLVEKGDEEKTVIRTQSLERLVGNSSLPAPPPVVLVPDASIVEAKPIISMISRVNDVATKVERNSSTTDLAAQETKIERTSSLTNLAAQTKIESTASLTSLGSQPAKIERSSSATNLAGTKYIERTSSATNLPEKASISPKATEAKVLDKDDLVHFDSDKGLMSVEEAARPPEPLKQHSPTSRLLLAADMLIPPTVEQQDFYILWGLSFVVPFFFLRFVFELVRRFILSPIRMSVRYAPGGNKFLSLLYIKLGPVVLNLARSAREKLPPMDSVNSAAKSGLEKFLATMQTAAGAAYPHLLHLAESIKTMKFREAATETIAVLKAWAPMLLLLGPLAKNTAIGLRQGWLVFWRVSKTAVYLPFGSFLRGAVQKLGQTLSENPDVFAERVAGLLGPIVGFFVAFIVLFALGLSVGLVDHRTLSSLYIGWFFKLLGMVSEPSVLDFKPMGNEDATAAIISAQATKVADGVW